MTDIAQEVLTRLGRQIEGPQEARLFEEAVVYAFYKWFRKKAEPIRGNVELLMDRNGTDPKSLSICKVILGQLQVR